MQSTKIQGSSTKSTKIGTKIDYTIELTYELASRLVYHITRKPSPFPTYFQIQTTNLCNGSCLMCPISREESRKLERMEDELYEKIIKEISENRKERITIWLYLQNEPLTDSDIFDKLKLIRKFSNRNIKTGLVTNGTLLSDRKIENLREADVDRICFSIDAYTRETYEKIRKGLNYNEVLRNIENLVCSNSNTVVSVAFLLQKDNYSELESFRNFWKNRGIDVEIDIVNNRGGSVPNFGDIRPAYKSIPLRKKFVRDLTLILAGGCYNLACSFNILWNGDVIMCCNDYNRRIILGNVHDDSIREIWNGEKYQSVREAVFNKDFEEIPECKSCSLMKYSWMKY